MKKRFGPRSWWRHLMLLFSIGLGLFSCQSFTNGVESQSTTTPTASLAASPTQTKEAASPNPTGTSIPISQTTSLTFTAALTVELPLTIALVNEPDFIRPITDTWTLESLPGDVFQVAWYDTYSGLLAASSEGIVLYSGEELTGTHTLWNNIAFRSVAYLPSMNFIVGGSLDARIYWWDLTDGEWIGTTTGHRLSVASLMGNPQESQLISASDDGSVRTWNLTSVLAGDANDMQPASSVNPLSNRIASLAVSPNGQWFAAGGEGKAVVWPALSVEDINILTPLDGLVNALEFSVSGNQLTAADRSGAIQLWDTQTWSRTLVIQSGLPGQITALDYHPDGSQLAIGTTQGDVELWHLPLQPYTSISQAYLISSLLTRQRSRIVDLAFNENGDHLAVVSTDGNIRIWKIAGTGQAPAPATPTPGITRTPAATSALTPSPTATQASEDTPVATATPAPTQTAESYPQPSGAPATATPDNTYP